MIDSQVNEGLLYQTIFVCVCIFSFKKHCSTTNLIYKVRNCTFYKYLVCSYSYFIQSDSSMHVVLADDIPDNFTVFYYL